MGEPSKYNHYGVKKEMVEAFRMNGLRSMALSTEMASHSAYCVTECKKTFRNKSSLAFGNKEKKEEIYSQQLHLKECQSN